MSRLPRISVIMPSLNAGRFIERALCSVIDQGYPDLEFIVVDGGSIDDTLDVLRFYSSDLATWKSGPDEGPADAINQGLNLATGELITVLNADNVMMPGTLHRVAECMSAQDAPRWLIGQGLRIGAYGEHMGAVTAEAPTSLQSYLMHDSGFLPLQGAFYHSELFDHFRGFNSSMQLAYGYEMSCRLLGVGVKPAILKTTLIALREHAESRAEGHVFQLGHEHIESAELCAEFLYLPDRYALWQQCDERRRIYRIAESESQQSDNKRLLWSKLLRRPWWLGSEDYRRALLTNAEGAQTPKRRAA